MKFAKDLADKITEVLELSPTFKDCQQAIFINQFPKNLGLRSVVNGNNNDAKLPDKFNRMYKPTKAMKDICAKISSELEHDLNNFENLSPKGNVFDMMEFTPNRGAFEVYFMGVKLFSKIQCKMWPNIP